MRIDKWLWAARFFRTRSLASDAVAGGKVQLNGARVKPAREVRAGDRLEIHVGGLEWTIEVLALSPQRGPAAQARLLYSESDESIARRAHVIEQRRAAGALVPDLKGRPTKKERRDLDRWRGRGLEDGTE